MLDGKQAPERPKKMVGRPKKQSITPKKVIDDTMILFEKNRDE